MVEVCVVEVRLESLQLASRAEHSAMLPMPSTCCMEGDGFTAP